MSRSLPLAVAGISSAFRRLVCRGIAGVRVRRIRPGDHPQSGNGGHEPDSHDETLPGPDGSGPRSTPSGGDYGLKSAPNAP